jgi:hypothetical protein
MEHLLLAFVVLVWAKWYDLKEDAKRKDDKVPLSKEDLSEWHFRY